MRSREQELMARCVALKDGSRRARFVAGFGLPLQAVRLFMRRPKLLMWAIVPASINLVLFVVAVVLLVKTGSRLLSSAWSRPEIVAGADWFFWSLWWTLFAVMIAAVVVLSYFLVLMVGSLIASPFNDVLSKRVEQALTGQVVEADGSGVADWLESVVGTLKTFFSNLLIIVPLFGLNLIPVVGSLVYVVLAALVSSFFLVMDYAGSPLDRRNVSFREKVRLIVANKDFSGGFGAGAWLLMFVPFVNLVAMPVLVVAGTIAGLTLQSWGPVEKQLESGARAKRVIGQD